VKLQFGFLFFIYFVVIQFLSNYTTLHVQFDTIERNELLFENIYASLKMILLFGFTFQSIAIKDAETFLEKYFLFSYLMHCLFSFQRKSKKKSSLVGDLGQF